MNLHCPHCDSPQPATPLIAGKTWLCGTCSNSFGEGKAPPNRAKPGSGVQKRVESRRTGGSRGARSSSSRVPKVAGGVKDLGQGKKVPWITIGASVAVLVVIGLVASMLFSPEEKKPPRDDEETEATVQETGPKKTPPKPEKTKDPYMEFAVYHEANFAAELREKKGDLSGAISTLDQFLSRQQNAIEKLGPPHGERVKQEVSEFRVRLETALERQWTSFEEKFKRAPSLSARIELVRADLGALDPSRRGPAMELLLPQIDAAIVAAFDEADALRARGASLQSSAAVREGLVLSYSPDIRLQVVELLAGAGTTTPSPPAFLFNPLRALVTAGTPQSMSLAKRMIDQALAAPEFAARESNLAEIRDELASGRAVTAAMVDAWADGWGGAAADMPPGNCTPCSGTGIIVCSSCGGETRIVQPCPSCATSTPETTTTPSNDCPRCSGTGKIRHLGEEREAKLDVDADCWRLVKGVCSNCSAGIDGVVEYPVEADKICGTCKGFKGMKGKSDPLSIKIGPCDESGKVAAAGGAKCKDLGTTLQSRARSQAKDAEKLQEAAGKWQEWYAGLDAELSKRVKEKADNLKYSEFSTEYARLDTEKFKILEEFQTVSARINKLIEDIGLYKTELESVENGLGDLLKCDNGYIPCLICSGTPAPATTTTPKTACANCKGTGQLSRTCTSCDGRGRGSCPTCAGLGSTIGLDGPWSTMAADVARTFSNALVSKLKARTSAQRAPAGDARPKDWTVESFIPARLNDYKVRFDRPLSERRRGAVESALQWLALHQDPDGGWHRDTYSTLCRRAHAGGACSPDGTASQFAKPEYNYDVALTALAIEALLGAGYTEVSDATWGDRTVGDAVRAGLEYLVSKQGSDGAIGDRATKEFMDGHLIATAALAEAYGMTGAPAWKDAARKAVEFLLDELSPGSGLSMAFQGGKASTTLTGWGVMALKSAEMSGLEFDRTAAYSGAIRWLDTMTKKGDGGRWETQHKMGIAYPKLPDGSAVEASTPAMSAVALLCRAVIGDAEGADKSADAAAAMKDSPPQSVERDYFYWYFGSLAMAQSSAGSDGGWQGRLEEAVVATQAPSGALKGSWAPDARLCRFGGRIYATALNALALEAESRYPALRR